MADGDEECRSSALTVWPSIVLLMCSWHQKKASEKHMKDIKKTDVEIWDQLRFDITTLQLFSVDEESFNVAYKLLERKYVQEIEVDKELMTILREFFRYFSDEWVIYSKESMVSVRKPPRAFNEQLLGENEQNFQGNNVFL